MTVYDRSFHPEWREPETLARLVFIIAWPFLAVVLVFAATPKKPVWQVLPEVQVQGTQITLASLVKFQGLTEVQKQLLQQTMIGPSPQPGKTKTIAGETVHQHLASLGLEDRSVVIPEEIRITRESRIWTLPEVLEKIQGDFLPTLPWEEVRLEKVEWAENLVLPAGKTEVKFECQPQTNWAVPFYLVANFNVDGELVRKLFLRTTLAVYSPVPVSLVPLTPQEDITPGKIRWEKRRLTSLLHLPIANEIEFAEKRVRYSIPAGTLLTKSLLYAPPLIKRGDEVKLVYQDQTLQVTTMAKSLGSGIRGERVKVMNLESKREILAEVLDSKTVRVPY
jgi:flagella basal body P-ring formation protein FlgA